MSKGIWSFIFLIVLSLSCTKTEIVQKEEEEEEQPNPNAIWQVRDVFSNLEFLKPVEMVRAVDGSNRLFVVEQRGKVFSFVNDEGNPGLSLFLDLTDRVKSGGELGLLGMAFHPSFEINGKLYVHYTRENAGTETVISLLQFAKGGGNFLSEEVLLSYKQPFANHNAGSIQFGKDGYLYITSGDGGSGGDPQNNAQNLNSYLGKILRIDVDAIGENSKYGIPPDNPFINTSGAKPEIYAYGMRNPWKMTMDRETGKFWIADVGQSTKEEIDILEKGGNYGWKITEGFDCFSPANNCDKTGLIDPIFDYGTNDGRSITGGYVYRGTKLKDIIGHYVYGDYVSGGIWAVKYDETTKTATNKRLTSLIGALSSFGEDESGEIFMLNYQTGKIHKLVFE